LNLYHAFILEQKFEKVLKYHFQEVKYEKRSMIVEDFCSKMTVYMLYIQAYLGSTPIVTRYDESTQDDEKNNSKSHLKQISIQITQ